MRRILLWSIVAAILLAAVVYFARSRNHLDVTPDAAREIEKAKQR